MRGGGPGGCDPCRGDDRWCVLAVAADAQWRSLCRSADQPRWLENPAWRDAAGRAGDARALDAAISDWTAQRHADDVARLLQRAGIAAAAVLDSQDLLNDPQMRARGFFVPVEHPRKGALLTDRSPVRFTDDARWWWQAAPELGADGPDVLRDVLGYSASQIERLRRDGVLP